MYSELEGDESQSSNDCCDSPIGGPWWCSVCEVQLCDACWEKQGAHSFRARNSNNHRKTKPALAKIISSILDPEPEHDPTEQAKLYEEDYKTKWFGVIIKDELLTFYDFGQYSRLVVGMGSTDDLPLQYPSLSSFVGETGAGKSTLISALVKIKAIGNLPQVPTPIMGTNMSTRPISGEVHLFADSLTYTKRRPIFYADCEGFSGGNDPPMTALEEKHAQVAMAWSRTRARKISWPVKEQCSRQWIVENLYPRILFTFSDTICFVTKNLRVIEDVFCRLIIWAEKVFDKSINQPMLPHAIIVVNAVEVRDFKDTNDLWDVDSLTRKQLELHKSCLQNNPKLRDIKDKWEDRGTNIENLKDLLDKYYGNISIICVPHGRHPPEMINIQYCRLYDSLIKSSNAAMELRIQSGLLMTSDELGFYLENAFDHFSQSGTEPFNFLATAIRLHPIAQTFKDHLLKLATLLLTLYPSWGGSKIFKQMSRLVASSIFLDSKRKHYPQKGIFAKYEPSCATAQSDFYTSYMPCDQQDSHGRRCVNVFTGHAKGHQSANGRIFSSGPYSSPYHKDVIGEKDAFLDAVRQEFNSLKEKFQQKVQGKMDRVTHIDAATFHREECLKPFVREYIQNAESLESHQTCFGCLFETPVHVLYCGHVVCRRCITDFGVRSSNEVEITDCPLCLHSDKPWEVPWKLQLMPPYSGLRVLSLDGGGVRGIIQLTILEIIEERIDLGMPIQLFFDLIIGTSAGGMVALALGSNLLPVKECKKIFRSLCKRAFTKHFLAGFPGVGMIVRGNHHGIYKTDGLEKALTEVFKQKPIFGGKQVPGSPAEVKVGVVSTSSSGQPYLHANYNRAQSKNDTRYVFLRGDNHKEELQVWEAARASSAAPTYFRSFFHEKTGHTFTDGALYHNNPVQVADTERKLLWPHLSHEPPALLLSIGTGFDSTTKSEIRPSPRVQSGPFGYIRHLFQIAWAQLQTSLDCEEGWKNFIRPLDLRDQDDLHKYCRLNQDYGQNLPRLDDVEKMGFLEESTRACFMQNKLIDQAVDTLFASLFYFKLNSTRREDGSDIRWYCEGQILCQLPAGTNPLKRLVQKLWRLKSSSTTIFVVKERPTAERHIPFPSDEFLAGVRNGNPFELDVNLSVYEDEDSRIYLQLFRERRGLIGGFPRSIVAGRYRQAEENRSWTL